MNYPKVIFTYIDIEGKETSLAVDIRGCCTECEMDKIFEVFDNFIGCIVDTVDLKYNDSDEDDEETKANKAKFDKRYFSNDDDDDEYIGLTD